MFVFLDTSIFETNNFLEGHAIKQLLKLSEENALTIVLTRITYNEIISRFKKNVKANTDSFNTLRNKARAFRNLPSSSEILEPIDAGKMIEEFVELLDHQLRKAKCVIIEYPTVNIGEVFDKYFELKAPFGAGQKKDEFPDAFILLSLENWCKEKGIKCHVLSNDKDMQNYKSSDLVLIDNYVNFLDQKSREVEADKALIADALNYFDSQKNVLKSAVEKWLLANLNDEKRFIAPNLSTVILGVVEIKGHSVKDIESPKIIGVHPTYIEVEAQALISYDITALIPESGVFLPDGTYVPIQSKDIDVQQEESISVLVDINLSPGDVVKKSYDLEIIEINGGEDLAVKGGQRLAAYPHHNGIRGYRPDLW